MYGHGCKCFFPCFFLFCRVWSWGWGVHGQLGLKSVDDRATPTHSSLLDNKQVSYIAAGYGHSAILTAEVRNLVCMYVCMYVCCYFICHTIENRDTQMCRPLQDLK